MNSEQINSSIWADSECTVDDECVSPLSANLPKKTSTFRNTMKNNKGRVHSHDRPLFRVNQCIDDDESEDFAPNNKSECVKLPVLLARRSEQKRDEKTIVVKINLSKLKHNNSSVSNRMFNSTKTYLQGVSSREILKDLII